MWRDGSEHKETNITKKRKKILKYMRETVLGNPRYTLIREREGKGERGEGRERGRERLHFHRFGQMCNGMTPVL